MDGQSQVFAPKLVGKAASTANVVWPNPSNGQLNLSNMEPGTVVVITDLNGRSMYTGQVSSTSLSSDISHLSSGLYLLNTYNHHQLMSSHKWFLSK